MFAHAKIFFAVVKCFFLVALLPKWPTYLPTYLPTLNKTTKHHQKMPSLSFPQQVGRKVGR
jgi:hypothetical protein